MNSITKVTLKEGPNGFVEIDVFCIKDGARLRDNYDIKTDCFKEMIASQAIVLNKSKEDTISEILEGRIQNVARRLGITLSAEEIAAIEKQVELN